MTDDISKRIQQIQQKYAVPEEEARATDHIRPMRAPKEPQRVVSPANPRSKITRRENPRLTNEDIKDLNRVDYPVERDDN